MRSSQFVSNGFDIFQNLLKTSFANPINLSPTNVFLKHKFQNSSKSNSTIKTFKTMQKPIFRSYPNQPAPVRQAQPNAARKVVTIPVHFVESDAGPSVPDKRFTVAVKIQKVFRGFMVRKSMKQILAIQREVDDVEKRILGILDVIKRDAKEKLRVNETLMGLLFKLDSVRGVAPGVRECRKAVIKKAIFLQEIIDGSDEKSEFPNDSVDSTKDVEIETLENDSINTCTIDLDTDTIMEESEVVNEQNIPDELAVKLEEDVVKEQKLSEKSAISLEADGADRSLEIDVEASDNGTECQSQEPVRIQDAEENSRCDCEDEEDYCIVKKVVGETEGEDYDVKPAADQKVEEDNSSDKTMFKAQEYEAKETKMMETMMEENAKMMTMMKELAEQNREQTQMLGLLSRRVELLEKALVCEKLRKKMKEKKKRGANGATESLDFCPEQKKCGKK